MPGRSASPLPRQAPFWGFRRGQATHQTFSSWARSTTQSMHGRLPAEWSCSPSGGTVVRQERESTARRYSGWAPWQWVASTASFCGRGCTNGTTAYELQVCAGAVAARSRQAACVGQEDSRYARAAASLIQDPGWQIPLCHRRGEIQRYN
ncbi:hypothetical protein [Enterococcus innesii]|uniref:hypothetical protein n=1 Tax=Enterococcus innesii TaxID=2839759 RepID=UPI003DA28F19